MRRIQVNSVIISLGEFVLISVPQPDGQCQRAVNLQRAGTWTGRTARWTNDFISTRRSTDVASREKSDSGSSKTLPPSVLRLEQTTCGGGPTELTVWFSLLSGVQIGGHER